MGTSRQGRFPWGCATPWNRAACTRATWCWLSPWARGTRRGACCCAGRINGRGTKLRLLRVSVAAESAGAQRGREVEVGLQAAIHLDGGVAGADDALALAPGGQRRNLLAKERVEASDNPVIEAYQT